MKIGTWAIFLFLCYATVTAAEVQAGIPPRAESGFASRIKHIIILMMENRSFDHLLGWLKTDWNAQVDGLQPGDSCPRVPGSPRNGSVPITRNGYDIGPDDPFHDFCHTHQQINDNHMNGFVYDAILGDHNQSNPVSMFDTRSAPIINTLAKDFAVFDNWFCSLPGPTDPNRAFAMSGTSRGIIDNFNGTLWGQQSYFDYLRANGHSFAAYYQDDPWAIMYFKDTHLPENKQFIHELDDKFYDDVSKGELPEFTWLQPRMLTHGNNTPTWQHPDAAVTAGEHLIKRVYEALRSSPIWDSTLFLITYDEHGGFYDHVVPPLTVSPDNYVARNGFRFDRLGVRIPTVAVSPWLDAGTLVSSEKAGFQQKEKTKETVRNGKSGDSTQPASAFDSTSILATSNRLLGVKAEPLTARMAWSRTFEDLLSKRSHPRTDCPVHLPHVPSPGPLDAARQRARSLNHHLEAQLLFYCVANDPFFDSQNEDPQVLARGRTCFEQAKQVLRNQGTASDWILEQVALFKKRNGMH